jgi:hypothetical protein
MKNKQEKYFAEFLYSPKGKLTVKMVNKHVKINQYKNIWQRIDPRTFTKLLNQSKFASVGYSTI